MIPDPSTAGRDGRPARDGTHASSQAGHIHCAACGDLITPDQYPTSSCWTGPLDGGTVAAHNTCLGIYDDIVTKAEEAG